MTKIASSRIKAFHQWLQETKNPDTGAVGLTLEDFARLTSKKHILNYSTVVKWSQGSEPRNLAKSVYSKVWPDCPLFK